MDHEREFNSYAPPKAPLVPETTPPGEWSAAPRRVPAVNGLLWWWRAARVLAARPGLWAAALCLVAAVPTVLTVVVVDPKEVDDVEEKTVLFLIHFWLFWPVLTGGIVNAAHKHLQGERIRLRDIFAFFCSGNLFVGWSCVGFFVTPPMFFGSILLFVALEALHLTSAATPFLALALAVFLVTGNMFIAAAAALHGEWPLRVIFRAGLVNMPAFLLNLPAATLAICAVPFLTGRIESRRLAQSLTMTEYALVYDGALALVSYAAIGALALVAYAAVRDIFFVHGKATAQPTAAS